MNYRYENKYCATCEYWDGNRSLSADKKYAQTKDGDYKGICLNNKSMYNKRESNANYGSCPYFTKWSKLAK